MSTATIDRRGRATVPVDIRKFLGLQAGMRLRWGSRANGSLVVGVLASDDQAFEGLEPLYLSIAELTPRARLGLIARGVKMDDFDKVATDMGVTWAQLADWIGLAHPATGGAALLRTVPDRPARRLLQLAYLVGQVEKALAKQGQAGAIDAPMLVARRIAEAAPSRGRRWSVEVLSSSRDNKKLLLLIEEFSTPPSAKA